MDLAWKSLRIFFLRHSVLMDGQKQGSHHDDDMWACRVLKQEENDEQPVLGVLETNNQTQWVCLHIALQ